MAHRPTLEVVRLELYTEMIDAYWHVTKHLNLHPI